MMGRHDNGQGQLFYSFDLDEVVPADHMVREIDRVLDLSNYLIDVEHGIVVDVEASRAIRQPEVGASQTMIERTEA